MRSLQCNVHRTSAGRRSIAYGAYLGESERLIGVYCGRIFNGEKPSRPAGPTSYKGRARYQPQDGQALDLTFPMTLLGRADEVIE